MNDIIGIHLDLKYVMPRKSYLIEWVRRLPSFGINTILLEYEDKFPYQSYPFLQVEDAFTPDELREFLAMVRDAGIRPIPLVQSLSHLEFALGHLELAHLRETPQIETQICPSNNEAIEMLRTMIGEVLSYHQEEDFFHLGGDETWFLGSCPECKDWMERCGKEKMWVEHQQRIMEVVRDAGKRPIYWDDIFWGHPEIAAELGIPRDVVFHCWNYSVTGNKKNVSNNLEMGGDTSGMLEQVDAYSKEGFDTIAGPCLDFGVLYPQKTHCLRNTQIWAQKMHDAGMLGIINTAWACFHVPLPAMWLHIAATGALSTEDRRSLDRDWECSFLKEEFGAIPDKLPEALETLGELWEEEIDGLARPVTPVVYGCMDMVLHYAEGQEERKRRGQYPFAWDEIDFKEIQLEKIELLRSSPKIDGIQSKINELLLRYAEAAEILKELAKLATTQKREAELLCLFGEMKLLHTKVLCFLLSNKGDGASLLAELEEERIALRKSLAHFLEPASVERLLAVWWEPDFHALKELLCP